MSADDSSRDDRNDHMNNIEDIYNENGSRDESVCRDYASTYSFHSSNSRGQNTKQHRNPLHRRSRRAMSSQHSTSTTSSMSTSNSNNNKGISDQQFWTTLSIHAASALMSSTVSTSIIPKQLKIEAATIASTSLLQHATTRGKNNKKRQEKITSQTIRNAASKASIAILSNCGNADSDMNTELAIVVPGAILKEGNRMLREMNQVDCRDDKSETGLSKKSSFTSSTKDSSISTTSEGGGTSLHHRTHMKSTSPVQQDTMQDDQTIQSISTSKFGSDKYQQLDQPKRKKKNDTTSVTVRSISTSKYGKDKYAIDIVDSARSVSGEESSVPAVITKKSRVSVKDSLTGGSIGSRSLNKDKRSSRVASIQSKESNRMEAVAAGSTLSSLSVYTEPPKASKEEATKASSSQSIANNSDDPSQVTTHQGDTSYIQSSVNSISLSQKNSNEQMQHIQLQEEELERKHANFLAAMEKLQSKLDILEGHGVQGQQQPGSLTREQLLSLAAKSSESPSDLSMLANPTMHNLSSTESLSIYGRYSIPHCSTSVLSSMNNKLQPQSHNYHQQQPQRPIRSVLRQPTRCFPIIEGEDQEYDDEDLQEFCKDLYNNLEGDATWDEDGSVFLSVGECRTMHCEDNRDKYAEGGVPEKTTEEAIEIVLLKDGDQHEQSSESLKNRVKDFFRGKRSKKVTFDVDIDPSTRNTSSGRYTPTSSVQSTTSRRSRARKLLRRLKLQRSRLMKELRNLGRRYANEPKPSKVREDIIITRTGMDTPSQRVEEGKKADDDLDKDTAQDKKSIDLDISRRSTQQSLPSSADSLAPQIRFKKSSSTDSTNTSQAVCETLTENITTKDENNTDDKVLVEAMAVVAEAQKGVRLAGNAPEESSHDEDASQYVANVVQAKDDEISCGVETVLSKKEVESVLSTKEVQSVASSSPSLFGFNFV